MRGIGEDSRERKPMVALVAHDIHDDGGMERACAELIRRGSGEVDFVVLAAYLAPELRPLVRQWVRVPVPSRPFPLKFMLFWFIAGQALRRLDVDLVHSVGAIVPNRVEIASVYHCHAGQKEALGTFAPSTMSGWRRLNTSISRRMALLAEKVCYRPSRVRVLAASTESLGEELKRYYPNIRVDIVPNGVDLDVMTPSAGTRDAKRAELSVAKDATVVLFLGGDWHRKGLPLILAALSLVERDRDLILWVVGRGDRAAMERVANGLGVLHCVKFIGMVPEAFPYYQAADLFILASSYETFSIPCFEAAACGLPIIVTDVHGAADLVRDGQGGILVEQTAESIASALGKLERNPELRHQMGAEARKRACSFTWQRSIDSSMEIYRDLLAE